MTVQTNNAEPMTDVLATSRVAYPRGRVVSPERILDNIKFHCMECSMPLDVDFLCTHRDGSQTHGIDTDLCDCATPDIAVRVLGVSA